MELLAVPERLAGSAPRFALEQPAVRQHWAESGRLAVPERLAGSAPRFALEQPAVRQHWAGLEQLRERQAGYYNN